MCGMRRWLTAVRNAPCATSRAPEAAFAAFVAQGVSCSAVHGARHRGTSSGRGDACYRPCRLYVRGRFSEYRAAGKHFLDAREVHTLLSFFLSPAAQMIGIPFPSVDDIAALRFTSGTPGSANAALWIHLYAVTGGAVVIVPRLVLALFATWQERRRSQRFVFDMSEPYFRRLTGSFVTGSARCGNSIQLHGRRSRDDGLRAGPSRCSATTRRCNASAVTLCRGQRRPELAGAD